MNEHIDSKLRASVDTMGRFLAEEATGKILATLRTMSLRKKDGMIQLPLQL